MQQVNLTISCDPELVDVLTRVTSLLTQALTGSAKDINVRQHLDPGEITAPRTAAAAITHAAAPPQPTPPPAQPSTSLTIADLRVKANERIAEDQLNREKVKQLLKDFGVASISNLEKESYDAFYQALEEL